MVDHLAGDVPVERCQPDGAPVFAMGIARQSSNVEGVCPHVSILFIYLVSPPSSIFQELNVDPACTYFYPICSVSPPTHRLGDVPVERNQPDGERNVPVFGMGIAHRSSNVEGIYPYISFSFFIWRVPPLTIHRYLTCY